MRAKWRTKAIPILREWRSNIIVWIVQWIGGSAMISAIGRALWREFHRAPLDWYFIGVVFVAGLILVVIGALLQNKHSLETADQLREIEAKIPQPITVNGILAGLPKQEQPASEERIAIDWRETFRNPQWKIINDHVFQNASIDVDGQEFSSL